MIRTYSLGFLALLLVSMSSCGGSESPTETPDAPTPVATTVTLSPTSVSFSVLGDAEQLTASVLDQNGAVMGGASASWSSSSTSVASVSSTGLVTAVADGTATITATSGSAMGTAFGISTGVELDELQTLPRACALGPVYALAMSTSSTR